MGRLPIIAIGIAALVIYGSFYFGRVRFGVDTSTYLQWHPEYHSGVPLGYPIFLGAFKETIGLRWAGLIQMALLVGACTFLALAVQRLTGRWIAGAVVLLLLLGHTEMFHLQGLLFSEALFTPLLLANVAAGFYFIATPTPGFAICAAATAAAAMFVRPAGYFLVAGVVFLMICHGARRAVWLVVPFLALVAGTFALNVAIRGSASQSQIGRVLLPHVAFMFDPAFASEKNRSFADAVEATMKVRRAEYQALPDRAARIHYSMFDYNKRVTEFDRAFHGLCEKETGKPCVNRDAIMLDLFLSTVMNHPLQYLQLVVDGLIEAWRGAIMAPWSGFLHVYRAEAALHSDRIQQSKLQQLPLTPDDFRLLPEIADQWQGSALRYLDLIRIVISKLRWLLYLAGIVSFVAMFAAIFSKSKRWQALGYCGVMLHGSMLLVAAVTVFIPRYGLPVDPLLLVAGVLMIESGMLLVLPLMRQR